MHDRVNPDIGAPESSSLDWMTIDWSKVNQKVKNLRQRIYRAESLSRMMGNCHVRFLGEGDGVTRSPLPDKSKKHGLGSFRLTGAIHIFERHIQLPRLGKLRLKERDYLPTRGAKILSATVSERAGRWFVSVQVEWEMPDPVPADKPIAGVDLGVKTLATVSDGTQIPNPKALQRNLQKVKRLQRAVSRKVKGSANRRKAVRKLARAHLRVANTRSGQNALHQATTPLAKTKSAIGVEDLNVSGMLKNHHLALAITDVGLGEFRRQLEYKGQWYGCRIVQAERFFPSSKRHVACGYVCPELELSQREWTCPNCGERVARDLNAALNLEEWARRQTTASSAESYACAKWA